MEVTDCISFVDYIRLSKEVTDKVGFLTLAFKRLHPHAPADDLICRNCETIWTITDYLEWGIEGLKTLPKGVRLEVLKRQNNTVCFNYDNCFKLEAKQ